MQFALSAAGRKVGKFYCSNWKTHNTAQWTASPAPRARNASASGKGARFLHRHRPQQGVIISTRSSSLPAPAFSQAGRKHRSHSLPFHVPPYYFRTHHISNLVVPFPVNAAPWGGDLDPG